MKESFKIEVIAENGLRPQAVIAPECVTLENGYWTASWSALRAWQQVGRVLGRSAIFDAELSKRFGRMVACTPQFARAWRDRTDVPHGFFLEVLS
jgi:hypothetical protein